jgi:hypothetical protein
MTPLPKERVVCPMIFPLIGKFRFRNGYNANRRDHRHTAIDISAPKMTPIVAPFSGTLGMKRETFWIYGDNGWAVLGTHLNDDNVGRDDESGTRDVMFSPELVPGQHIKAGRFIGYVGESGPATGPHLHFELFAPGKGPIGSRLRNPFASLKYAQKLKAPRPHIAEPKDLPEKGRTRYQGCVRKLDRDKHRMTLLLTGVQESSGRARAVTAVKYWRVNVDDATAQAAGGWESLAELPEEALVSVYTKTKPGPAGFVAERVAVAFE